MMDFARARRTMVDTQIRVNDVTDARIIEALMAVPREDFAPAERRELAYLDDDLLVAGAGQTARYLIEPMILAKMLQVAAVEPDHAVLDIGPATGYSSAVLARLAGSVVAVEEDESLAAVAKGHLSSLANVKLVTAPLAAGAAGEGPFDVILVEGAVEAVPDALLGQLKDGGRLVAVVGSGRAAKCLVHTRRHGEVTARPVFDAAIPSLPGFAKPRSFVF